MALTSAELTEKVLALEALTVNMTAELHTLETENAALATTAAGMKQEVNTFYLLWAGALIFLMQAGFATLSAGSIREKNVKNILLKNLLDACMGAITWYFIGYGFAYDIDGAPNAFIGGGPSHFALSGVAPTADGDNAGYDWMGWYFQFAFAAAAATIVSGAVAERCQLAAYLIYTCAITGFIYPVVVHWVWDGSGFLSAANPNAMLSGCIDFAGSGVVHMTGGWAALVGAYILGPRLGRFERPKEFEGHSTPLQVIGTFLLWFGWYGFNPGSTLALHGAGATAARACVTTTIAAAAGGVTGLLLKKQLPEKLGGTGVYDIGHTCNSLLGGLVGITAGCASVTPNHALLIGVIAAFVYHAASCMMRRFKIDDPLDAFAVHGACGAWGTIAVGLFTKKEYSYAPADGSQWRLDASGLDLGYDAGLFMPGTRGTLFATQLITVLIEIAWVVITSVVLFAALNKAKVFRVSEADEQLGSDLSKHGGRAYSVQLEPGALADLTKKMEAEAKTTTASA
jgi:Amt family ammonium transporter